MKKIYLGILIGVVAALAIALGVTALFGVFPFTRTPGPGALGLIERVDPAETLGVHENQIIQVNVRAKADCRVFVQLGATRVGTVATGIPVGGSNTFCAILIMPRSRQEIESLGYLRVSASRGEESESADGAKIVYQAMQTDTTQPTFESDEINVGNYVTQETTELAEPTPTTQPVQSGTVIPAGAKPCMVRVTAADTWPVNSGSDILFPSSTPLVRGTIDYVTGTTEMFNDEKQEMRSYYTLASGRKIRTDVVDLLSAAPQNDNQLQILSSAAADGTLQIRIKTTWAVPYDFLFAPQKYYQANGKYFNVSDFTADRIQFTFYYTTAASGKIDCSGSDVVSAAGWTVDAGQKTAALTFSLRNTGRYYGYTLQRDTENSFVLTIQNKPKSLAGSVIVLDPGHGGKDPGALGYGGAIYESQLNFALAVATKYALEQRGARVILTRTDDTYYTLEERKDFALQQNPDLFISIHCNATENKAHYGTSAYYYRPMSQPLAAAIHQRMLHVFQNSFYAADPVRRANAGEGARFYPFSVTRLEACPSILIETGYVTNDQECALLLDAGNRDKIAAAICDGIADYFAR